MTEQQSEYITETEEALQMLGKGYNNDPIPPNEFVAKISGFTLAPDVLINEYGYVTALVWGVTWRFCQMSDGVCRAKLEKIAARLGMSERTIIRHMDTLCQDGYLFDTTPTLKNKPHIYADTGKIKVNMSIAARVTESQRAMTESQRQGDRESVEESIKKQTKKEKIKAEKPPKPPTPPEILVFREVTRLYPPKNNWDDVVKIIQSVSERLGRPATKEDLQPFFDAWTFRAFKPTNINWTSWAVSGKIPQQGVQQKPLEPKGFEAVRKFMANHSEEVYQNG